MDQANLGHDHKDDSEPDRIETQCLHDRKHHRQCQNQHRNRIQERAKHDVDCDYDQEDQPAIDLRFCGSGHDLLRDFQIVESECDDVRADDNQENERGDDDGLDK
jgi:hypothetical protein